MSLLNRNDFNYTKNIKSYGDFEKVFSIDRLLDSLNNIFSTPRGTYPDDPTFGTILQKFCFDPQDEITKDNIIEEVKEVIHTAVSNAKIISIDIAFFTDKKGFIVEIVILHEGENKKLKIESYNGQVRSLL